MFARQHHLILCACQRLRCRARATYIMRLQSRRVLAGLAPAYIGGLDCGSLFSWSARIRSTMNQITCVFLCLGVRRTFELGRLGIMPYGFQMVRVSVVEVAECVAELFFQSVRSRIRIFVHLVAI